MRRVSMSLCIAIAVAVVAVAPARQIHVPEWPYTTIQLGINAAQDGDTVSVWVHVVPPDTYYENVVIDGKDVFLVNRSFPSNGGTGYDSSWDYVTIDGTQSGRVVTMTGSEDAVLKGFTIQHGHTDGYGGGVNCNAGSVLKNHILDNYAASGGGGVFFVHVQK